MIIWGDDFYERCVIDSNPICNDCDKALKPPFVLWQFETSIYFCRDCAMSFMFRFARDLHEIDCGPNGGQRKQNLLRAKERQEIHRAAVKEAFPDAPELWDLDEEEFYKQFNWDRHVGWKK